MKEKKRYIAFEVLSTTKIPAFSEISKAIWNAVHTFAGAKGTAEMGLQLFPETYDKNKQRGLAKVGHRHVNTFKASLTLVEHIDKQPVIVRSIGASGVLAKAKQKYIA